MKKRITWIGAIVLVLVSTLVIGIIGNVTNGFQDFDKETIEENMSPKVNADNLYTAANCSLVDTNDGYGVTVSVDEKTGAISLNGKCTASRSYEIGKVTLTKGTYTLTAISGAARNGAYVTLAIPGDSTLQYFDFEPDNTINITSDSVEVTIFLNIAEGAEFGNKAVLPVIVSGEEPGQFYK